MKSHLINSQLICAQYDREYPMIDHGKGIYLYDKNGKQYIDASGATACVRNIGHGVEEVANALKTQALKLAVHPTHAFYNEELEKYLKALCDFLPAEFNHAWTICGGTEALENAVKLAYQYHRSKGNRRKKVIGRWGSYHGNSLTMLDIGGNMARREYYTDLMVNHLHVSACNPYRKPDHQSVEEYEDSLIQEFEKNVYENKDDILAFVAEPIVGAALGAMKATPNYFNRIHKICKENDILLIADEVMTGIGRTGENMGMDHYQCTPDIICMAKGISSGYFPLGAVIAHDHVMNTLKESKKPFFSGQTYSCIPLAASVGLAVLKYHQDHKLIQNSKKIGNYLKSKWKALLDYDHVGDIRGEGLFLGIEFVSNKVTKAPIEDEFMFAKKVEVNALDLGLVLYGCKGSFELKHGDHLLITPPLIMNEPQADEMSELLIKAIKKTHSDYQDFKKSL